MGQHMSKIESVRQIMGAAEDVDLPEGLDGAPADDGGADSGQGGDRSDPPHPPSGPPSPASLAAQYPLNDYGNGQRFATYFGDDLRFVPRVAWFVWDEQRWRKDPDEIKVRRKAQLVAEKVREEIPHLVLEDWQMRLLAELPASEARVGELREVADPDDETRAEVRKVQKAVDDARKVKATLASKRKEHHAHARASGNTNRISHLMTESQVQLARDLEELDADPLAINTASCTLRFSVSGGPGQGYSRTASMSTAPHAREDMLTKLIPVDYDRAATAPGFDAFLQRVLPDRELRQFVQRWMGLSMTALTGEQKLVFLYGGGANGKSVLVDLIARVMGDYAATAKIESLTGRNRRSGGDATPDLVPLIGARMVRASEPEEGDRLQEAKIKELTGGEPILVRALQEDFVEVRPQFKLTISGNHKPEIRGGDDGIWRRVLLVPFDVQIPLSERDPLLGEKLWRERAGVLNWMIDGLIDYLEGGLQIPEAITAATAEYREESDPLGTFLTDCCEISGVPEDKVSSADMVNAFNYWRLERGVEQWKGTTITRQLASKSKTWKHPETGRTITKGKSSVAQYEGLRFTSMFRDRFERAPADQSGRRLARAADLDPPAN